MANFFTDIAPNVIFSKDPTAVIDYYVQHKLLFRFALYRYPSCILILFIDYYIQRCIIGKEFDITIKIINNIVYVYKEQERAQH
jgi:hypothetical protein